MNILIYFGIFVIIVGIMVCIIGVWAVVTHREKTYNRILHEHIQQMERVKNKLSREEDKRNED